MKKHILLTGSTDGIGKETALLLAKAGHHLYLHGRNKEKLAQLRLELKAVSDANIETLCYDLADFQSIEAMCLHMQQLEKLDVLINNAGVFTSSYSHTKEGIDIRMMVNYIAVHQLTMASLALLKKSNDGRVINLSSAAQAPVNSEFLAGGVTLDDKAAYSQSKLALTIWSLSLAKKEPSLCIIPVNPGSLLNTKMVQEAFGHHWSSVDKGATILYQLSTDPTMISYSGQYYDNDKESFGKAHDDAYDTKAIERLEKETAILINKLRQTNTN